MKLKESQSLNGSYEFYTLNLLLCSTDLQDQITVGHESVYDHKAPKGKLYDVAYFGASFMLMPDQVKWLYIILVFLCYLCSTFCPCIHLFSIAYAT